MLDGFTNGFDIGYNGPTERQSYAENILITTGSTQELWLKIMKEVSEKRYAGPFTKVPFTNFIQSPIGLVPKAGNKTRLIFHLSFEFTDREGNKVGSVNACTPHELCLVKYRDLDAAVSECLKVFEYAQRYSLSDAVFLGKTDLSSAFHVLPLKKGCYCWLVMKAVDPRDNKVKYFIEKCLLFGTSISCSHYQRFSNALKHIVQWKLGGSNRGKELMNYLDDFLFLAYSKMICDGMITVFLETCKDLSLPVAWEKIEWSETVIVFLGILLDGKNLVLSLPIEKQKKALRLVNEMMHKKEDYG